MHRDSLGLKNLLILHTWSYSVRQNSGPSTCIPSPLDRSNSQGRGVLLTRSSWQHHSVNDMADTCTSLTASRLLASWLGVAVKGSPKCPIQSRHTHQSLITCNLFTPFRNYLLWHTGREVILSMHIWGGAARRGSTGVIPLPRHLRPRQSPR